MILGKFLALCAGLWGNWLRLILAVLPNKTKSEPKLCHACMPVVDSYLVCLYGLCLLVFGRLVTTVWTQSAQRFVEKDQRETNIQKHYTQDSMFRGCGCHYVQNRPQALYLTYQMTCLLRSLQHQRCMRIRWRHTADL